MIDYVLNVAVGISAGVAALVSAVPMLHPYTLALCLGILALLTLANLRGTTDASRLFALPTYLFVIMVPWYLTPPKIKDALTQEEASEPVRVRIARPRRRKRPPRQPIKSH
jgi:hypothetical protein